MKRLEISPHPNNFTVWYMYFAETFPNLKKDLDALIEGEQEFNEKTCDEIFERFFPSDKNRAVLNDTTIKIEAELTQLLDHLKVTGDGAADYGKTLESFSGQLVGTGGVKDLQAMISTALSATQVMQQRNAELEESLNASSNEVTRLRKDLTFMRHEASTDSLTGIANRKLFDSELQRAAKRAKDEGEELCLLIIDIDHFKKFNDTYGHQTGDKVLKLLALTLTESIKGQDTAARYGGEEFAVILPHTSMANALKVAEEIRLRVANRKVRNRVTGETLGQINVSIGVGRYDSRERVTRLIARADRALYRAKETGRNRVVSQDEIADWRDIDDESKLMVEPHT